MANYLICCGTSKKIKVIQDWLDNFDVPHTVYSPYASCQILTVGLQTHAGSSFTGYAVDYLGRKVLLEDSLGCLDPASPLEGCYVAATRMGDGLVVGNDLFAQLSMLYFEEPDLIAISDSTLLLCEIRRRLNIPCQLDVAVFRARSWLNGMAAQLLSVDTPIEGIKFAVPGQALRISLTPSIRCELSAPTIRDSFPDPNMGYPRAMRSAAINAASLVGALLKFETRGVGLSLSGGFDSRVCLAAARAATGELGALRIGSNAALEDDFRIVTGLSKQFGFAVNQRINGVQTNVKLNDQLAIWFLTCAGIYDPLYCPARRIDSGPGFSISGHGAELYKGNYGWRSVHAIADGLDPTYAAWSRADMEAGLRSVGISPDEKWSAEWHYLSYRNPIHSGRSTMFSLLGVRPLAQRALVGLAYSPENVFPAPKKGRPSLVSDLLIALDPELAIYPFDKPEKNLSEEFVQSRIDALGGAIGADELVDFDIVGEMPRRAGALNDLLKIPQSMGFSGSFRVGGIAGLLEEAVLRIPAGHDDYIGPLIAKARELEDPVMASSRPAMAAGKLLGTLLADW